MSNTLRLSGACNVQRILVGLIINTVLMLPTACAVNSDSAFHFTFGISDLYAPFLTKEENRAALDSLSTGAEITATFTRKTRKFRWTSNLSGVTGLFAPGFQYDYTEKYEKYTLSPESGNPGQLGADIPPSLEGGYVLSNLWIQVSPEGIYRQPGYRSLIQKLPAKNQLHDLPSPTFEYLVSIDNSNKTDNRTEHQGCLFVSTPFGFPEVHIPVVTRVSTTSKRIILQEILHQSCPWIPKSLNNKFDGRLPLARVAAAQSHIDFSTTFGSTSKGGKLPVTESMTRWFHRNKEGTYAGLNTFGPFEEFSMRLRWDNTYPSGDRLPIRTERWSFFNQKLVKYSADIFYNAPGYGKFSTAQETVYFQDGQLVGSKSDAEKCSEKACLSAHSELKRQTSRPYEEILNEVLTYRHLPYIPAE